MLAAAATRGTLTSLAMLAALPALGGCEMLLAPVAAIHSSAMMLGQNIGRMEIQGEVVDETGQPLQNVQVRVSRLWLSRPVVDPFQAYPFVTDETTHVVNGGFDFSWKGSADVFLRFTKPGYWSESVRAASGSRHVKRDALPSPAVAPLLADPAGSYRKSLRIVLERQQNPTTLHGYERVMLTFGKGGATGGTAADFDALPAPNPAGVQVPDLLDPAQLPRHGAYLLPATVTGESGTVIDTIPIPSRGDQRSAPRSLRLVICGDGGFAPVRAPSTVNVLRGMKTAPAEGYLPQLVMDEADVGAAFRPGGQAMCFYFRTGQRYGKGRLGFPQAFSSDARVDVEFFIQPDGSRNLESGSDYP